MASESITKTKEEIIIPKFTQNEYNNYTRQKDKAHFTSPEEEYKYGFSIYKICSKCKENKKIIFFNGNTAGADAFDKNGYRLRRPECGDCTRKVDVGKKSAEKLAKEQGISYTAPDGSKCSICNKQHTEKNKLVFDHCHQTNKFRGYCCNSCNRSLGGLGDDVKGLINALNYLLKSQPTKISQNENGFLDIHT